MTIPEGSGAMTTPPSSSAPSVLVDGADAMPVPSARNSDFPPGRTIFLPVPTAEEEYRMEYSGGFIVFVLCRFQDINEINESIQVNRIQRAFEF